MNLIERGEIYYAKLPGTVGSEQNGERPVLIIQNNTGNFYSSTTIVAAITSKLKSNMPTHVYLNNKCLPINSLALLEQLRTIDKRRLSKYLGKLSKEEMETIDTALAISVGLSE